MQTRCYSFLIRRISNHASHFHPSLGTCPDITRPTAFSSLPSLRGYKTGSGSKRRDLSWKEELDEKPGSVAFADCEADAIADLFYQFAQAGDGQGGIDDEGTFLTVSGVKELLGSIGERPDDITVRKLFVKADSNDDGKLHLNEFLSASDKVLGDSPARVVLVVGGPGSGKGILCKKLVDECGIVHLSSGDLLRDEVSKRTPLGRECAEIMARGDLVSSAVITALVRRRMRSFPGRRVLLDGFPRSLENAYDFVEICGKPELALHLDCDDTILMERIIKRGREGAEEGNARVDDNIDTALQRLRTFHKSHRPTMDWLRDQHVPIVNLDCSGTPENVWNQLIAIGRLMRPAAAFKEDIKNPLFFTD
mmetsp:Transcript_18405/g.25925  ORF Transcript_18405/g.25925 Transcript_18405/m.25925 type:complete len:365 (-) Transcript_18405:493-1587(-)|eukprot:CAMPEP_0184864134 /NCGR_PEP_ID=MMETSP0580-20130426/13898_1 /TAXON_ID=1118495 /ORGANISM="Dactyliosolen fragilissimus" /LENGTH=364 /DNA_ID=CAMNT_0027362793 /DNA_START=40 /DNA_END=1134 /DNA_ORIENTATION=+